MLEIRLIKGDITRLEVDAIVNAANSHLQHGGGVAGAIVAAGGRVIQIESDRVGYVPVGGAAVTGAGSLPARYVIHAVGPRLGEGDEENKLRNATLSALREARALGLASLAFPAISTGIFGFPVERGAPIMVAAVRSFSTEAGSLQTVTFCLFSDSALEEFRKATNA